MHEVVIETVAVPVELDAGMSRESRRNLIGELSRILSRARKLKVVWTEGDGDREVSVVLVGEDGIGVI